MNEDAIADLKQFIAATIPQQMAGVTMKDDLERFATRDDIARLEGRLMGVEQKLDDVKAAIAEAMDLGNEGVERN